MEIVFVLDQDKNLPKIISTVKRFLSVNSGYFKLYLSHDQPPVTITGQSIEQFSKKLETPDRRGISEQEANLKNCGSIRISLFPEEVRLKEPAFMLRSENLRSWFFSNESENAKARLYTLLNNFLSTEKVRFSAIAVDYGVDKIPSYFYFEYYEDPYYFCVDANIELIKENGKTFYNHNFLHDDKILETIANCKKVLPKNELITLIKKHSSGCKLLETKYGFGLFHCFKKGEKSPVYQPRFAIREKLRRKGLDLEEGITELDYYSAHAKDNIDTLLAIAGKLAQNENWDISQMGRITLRQTVFKYRPKGALQALTKCLDNNNPLNIVFAAEDILSGLIELNIIDEVLDNSIKKSLAECKSSPKGDLVKSKKLADKVRILIKRHTKELGLE